MKVELMLFEKKEEPHLEFYGLIQLDFIPPVGSFYNDNKGRYIVRLISFSTSVLMVVLEKDENGEIGLVQYLL